jgi:hypothetical protein
VEKLHRSTLHAWGLGFQATEDVDGVSG